MKFTGQRFIILGLTLLAFLLRAYRLDFQSLWLDEGWTVYFANLPLSELWHLLQTEEIHPPFYFPSLNIWRHLAGDSEFALRYYSLVFSVLAVPLIYRLGKALGGYRLGAIAALLLAVAPYQIWHAPENSQRGGNHRGRGQNPPLSGVGTFFNHVGTQGR